MSAPLVRNVHWVNKGNDFDYGWMRPDLSRQVWHVLTHLLLSGRGTSLTKHIVHASASWHDRTQSGQTMLLIHHQAPLCFYKSTIIFWARSRLSLLLAKFWYLESCRNYFPSWTGQIPLSPPLLIIEQYFVSGLISLAVLSVEINNKLKCGDGVQCELVQQCCKAVYYS